jgi:hypothetical protein
MSNECNCLMCLAEGDNSPHRLRAVAALEERGYYDCVECGDGKRGCTCGIMTPAPVSPGPLSKGAEFKSWWERGLPRS